MTDRTILTTVNRNDIDFASLVRTRLYAYAGGNPEEGVDPKGLDWVYQQSTGYIYERGIDEWDMDSPIVNLSSPGYAGINQELNNSAAQDQPFLGPLPAGTYDIGAGYYNSHTGPLTMNLTPDPNNDMYGRDLFRIHGDNSRQNKSASNGCIVADPATRRLINNSGDNVLQVVP